MIEPLPSDAGGAVSALAAKDRAVCSEA